jgi:phosphoserine phosphatase RsbU/P
MAFTDAMFRPKNRLGGKGTTLGVLVDWLGDPYQATVCAGIEQGAADAGANLLLFVGGALAVGGPRGSQSQQIYELAGEHNLDGLVVLSSTLSHNVGLTGVHAFCEQYAGLPLCSVGLPLPGVPSVTVDNEAGMGQVVRHLVDQHACKRIAFISGPPANAESVLRVRAYHGVLREYGLAIEDQLLVAGDFRMESGAMAVRTLTKSFGARLERLDAIVAANDNMAIGAMDELRAMGIAIAERLLVVGFDDVEEARLTEPSLTTSRQPLERLGREAVRLLLQGHGDADAAEQRISTDLVIRLSCGCSALGLGSRTGARQGERFRIALMGQRDRIAAQMGRAARGRFSAAGPGWEQSVLGALVDDLLAGSSQRFLPAVDRVTQRLCVARVDLNAIDDVLTAMRDELAPLLQSEPDTYRLAEDLFHAVRLATSAALQRGLGRAHLELTRWARRIAVACNTLADASGYAELEARMGRVLEALGIRSCFVCVYDTPGDPSQARVFASSEVQHSGAQRVGTVDNGSFRGRDLWPSELATADGVGRSFAVLPLPGHGAILGHVLIEYAAQHAFTCGVIVEALGIAIRNFSPRQHPA